MKLYKILESILQKCLRQLDILAIIKNPAVDNIYGRVFRKSVRKLYRSITLHHFILIPIKILYLLVLEINAASCR